MQLNPCLSELKDSWVEFCITSIYYFYFFNCCIWLSTVFDNSDLFLFLKMVLPKDPFGTEIMESCEFPFMCLESCLKLPSDDKRNGDEDNFGGVLRFSRLCWCSS